MRVCTASAGGFFLVFLTVLASLTMAEQQQSRLVGGMQKPQPVTQEVEEYVAQIRDKAEEAAGGKFETFTPVVFATQLVNGINYFVKVDVGNGQFVHIRFYKPFQGETVEFVKLVGDKTEKDPLEYIR